MSSRKPDRERITTKKQKDQNIGREKGTVTLIHKTEEARLTTKRKKHSRALQQQHYFCTGNTIVKKCHADSVVV